MKTETAAQLRSAGDASADEVQSMEEATKRYRFNTPNMISSIVPDPQRAPEAQIRWALIADVIERLASDHTFSFLERTQLGLLAITLRTAPRLAATLGRKQPKDIMSALVNHLNFTRRT